MCQVSRCNHLVWFPLPVHLCQTTASKPYRCARSDWGCQKSAAVDWAQPGSAMSYQQSTCTVFVAQHSSQAQLHLCKHTHALCSAEDNTTNYVHDNIDSLHDYALHFTPRPIRYMVIPKSIRFPWWTFIHSSMTAWRPFVFCSKLCTH